MPEQFGGILVAAGIDKLCPYPLPMPFLPYTTLSSYRNKDDGKTGILLHGRDFFAMNCSTTRAIPTHRVWGFYTPLVASGTTHSTTRTLKPWKRKCCVNGKRPSRARRAVHKGTCNDLPVVISLEALDKGLPISYLCIVNTTRTLQDDTRAGEAAPPMPAGGEVECPNVP